MKTKMEKKKEERMTGRTDSFVHLGPGLSKGFRVLAIVKMEQKGSHAIKTKGWDVTEGLLRLKRGKCEKRRRRD